VRLQVGTDAGRDAVDGRSIMQIGRDDEVREVHHASPWARRTVVRQEPTSFIRSLGPFRLDGFELTTGKRPRTWV
jgi:hypothetical protein